MSRRVTSAGFALPLAISTCVITLVAATPVVAAVTPLGASALSDLNGDGYGDLAIGVPSEDIADSDEGAINVLYVGLAAAGNQVWSQDTRGIAGGSDLDDHFGRQLTAADLGRSGHADLVVAVPGEGTASKPWLGAVSVLYGSTTGLTYTGNQLWSQDSAGIADVGEPYDAFGVGVSAR